MRDEYAECFQFCNDWLKAFPDHLGLRRLRAEVLADGYSIGKSEPDGTRIVESSCLEFFEDICEKTVLRKTSDLCYLGRLYEWMGHFDEAYSLLDEAESIDRDYWEVYLHRASFLWRSQKFESALEEALVAVERAPWHVMPWSILSKIYTSLGNERQAKTSLDKIEAINEQCDHLFDPHEIHQLTQA